MIKAVIFDMFETLVTLFEGKPYFAEDIAADVGLDSEVLRKEWRSTDDDKSLGKITVEEALEIVFKRLGVYSEENVRLAAGKRAAALENTFNHIPDETFQMLKGLKDRGIKIGLMSNAYSDERDYIKKSPIFDYIDVPLISYEQGVFKPSPEMYKRMIERLGVDASECLFVGDGGSRELYAARDAGMHPVQCSSRCQVSSR